VSNAFLNDGVEILSHKGSCSDGHSDDSRMYAALLISE
jgi:uncharacterized membrane protein